MVQPATAGTPLSLPRLLAFACSSLPVAALGLVLAVYLPRYFAAHIGVSLLAVGGAFGIVRMIDIGVDLALGVAMDRTRTKWGRYRLWTVIGAPVLMLAVMMLFQAPMGISMTYLIGWLLVLYLGTSILTLSHQAWATTLATSYNERARVFATMTAVGVLGGVLVLGVPALAKAMGHTTEAQGVQAMGWFVFILVPIAVAIVVAFTGETITPNVTGKTFRLMDYWDLVKRPDMIRIMAADMCLTLGPGWMSALYLFFFKDSRGFTGGQSSTLLAIYILAGFAGAPLIGLLATRISKHRALMVTSTCYSLLLVMLFLMPKASFWLTAPAMFLAGFMAAGFGVMVRAMTADLSDEIRLEQGQERAGLMFAVTALTSKIANAGAITLTFSVLAAIGYQAREGAVNSPEAIRALELAYVIGPVVFVMLGGACFLGYSLSAERHAEIRSKLDARDALYTEAAIMESVTGEAAIPQTR